jgi:type IV pilus assembly protein PilQ
MMIKGRHRITFCGRWTYCLAASLSLLAAMPSQTGAQQYSTITVPEPDPQYAPPQKPIKYEEPTAPAPAPTVSKPAPVSPWTSRGLDALRSAVGAVVPQNEQVPARENPAGPVVAVPMISPAGETLPPAQNSTLSPEEPKEHHLPLGQPIPKDIVVKEDEGLISLMVRDAPLRQVVALIAETQNLNIVFASPADVPVTASFDRVPWEQALEALLSISGHTGTINDGIIFITNIEAADFVSPDAGGRTVQVFDLDFASAVDVEQTVTGLLSPAGKCWIIESSSEDNRRTREMVAVVDYPANLMRISEYVCQVDQPPRQVLIEANILEVELTDDCRSGIDFSTLANFHGNNNIRFGFLSAGVANPPANFNTAAGASTTFMTVDGPDLLGLVDLLKTTLDAKTLASPKVLAVSGQKANIQIGSQLGFRVTTTTQTGTFESIQFIDVGTVLTVTPRISRDGRVLMRVKPKVSTGQVDAGTGLPSEETTEVESDVLLNDGQGMVIGGLIKEEDSITSAKIPWVGDLPYVGILFQKRTVTKKRSEIIVTLIPHVQPYVPVIEDREQQQIMRAQDRLTYGPLIRNPRPYEPRMYDTFTNPRRPLANALALHHATVQGDHPQSGDIISFPPIEDVHEYEELPQVEGEPVIEFPEEQASYEKPVHEQANDERFTPFIVR